MALHRHILVALTALALGGAPAFAGPGGNGGGNSGGNGNGASNGNGGNSASAGSGAGNQSQGHGAETSAVASAKDTTFGLQHAADVVGTTPAAQQARDAFQAALDRFFARTDAED